MIITRLHSHLANRSVDRVRRIPWLPIDERPAFALSRPEARFAIALLRGHSNLWVFRCERRSWCGVLADDAPCQTVVSSPEAYLQEMRGR